MEKVAEERGGVLREAASEAAERVFVEWVAEEFRRDAAAAERGEAA